MHSASVNSIAAEFLERLSSSMLRYLMSLQSG